VAKWLLRWHLDNKHNHHIEVGNMVLLLFVSGDQGNKTTMPWMVGFWVIRKHDKHEMRRRQLTEWRRKLKLNGINLKFKALKRFVDLYW
jgi:hypothetical protein